MKVKSVPQITQSGPISRFKSHLFLVAISYAESELLHFLHWRPSRACLGSKSSGS